jgi:hypothetical protein
VHLREWRREKVRWVWQMAEDGYLTSKDTQTYVVLLCSRAPKSAGINCIFPLYCSTPCGYNIQNPLLWTRWWVTVQLLHLVTKDINPPLLGYIPHIQTLVRRYIWHMSTYLCRILQIWELGWLNQPSVSGGEWCHYCTFDNSCHGIVAW